MMPSIWGSRLNSLVRRFIRIKFLWLVVCALIGAAESHGQINIFTNPTPAFYDHYGAAVAAVGEDRILIGARFGDLGAGEAGAAYLYHRNGTLITSFTNPTLQAYSFFGSSLAAVDENRVLIGLQGIAYLFNTSGQLLTTFTNPNPSSGGRFGRSVASLGGTRVLIGDDGDDRGALNAGAAYLFSTNGVMLTVFTNPTPAPEDYFGRSLAAFGNDRILIGAAYDDTGAGNAGSVYMFRTNGTLLATFTNPAPGLSDLFGTSMAGVGRDWIVIGANRDDAGVVNAGSAYLFSTNGTLLATFANPLTGTLPSFGSPVVAVGTNRVLIGAWADDAEANHPGAAFLFSLPDGALLTTFTNPTPENDEFFGSTAAALGTNAVVIGAYADNLGAPAAGVAYLFSLLPEEAPWLNISRHGSGQIQISWPTLPPGYRLQEALELSPTQWSNAPSGSTNPTFVPGGGPKKFFRLFKP